LNVGDPEIVNAPAKVIFPEVAVKVPPLIVSVLFKSDPEGRDRLPELKTTGPEAPVIKLVYPLKFAVPPATVNVEFAFIPVNPDNELPALKLNTPRFSVPVPVKTPLLVSPVEPFAVPIVGLFPKGKVQLLLTVFVPVV
jgi:hypothetical protein